MKSEWVFPNDWLSISDWYHWIFVDWTTWAVFGAIVFGVILHFSKAKHPVKGQRNKVKSDYDRVKKLQHEVDVNALCKEISEGLLGDCGDNPLVLKYVNNGILTEAQKIFEFPKVYNDSNLKELGEMRAFIAERERFINRGYLDDWKRELRSLYVKILHELPIIKEGTFNTYVYNLIDIRHFVDTIYNHVFKHKNLFPDLHKKLSYLMDEAECFPTESELPPHELAEAYLSGTPFFPFMDLKVGITFPPKLRLQHTHVCARSGHGKTQAIQYLICQEKGGFCVIDSQGDMLKKIAKRFDNVILLDPEDIEYSLCLNMFDVDISGKDKERILNATLSLYEYMFSAIGADLTQRQNLIFSNVARLLFEIPNATIVTMLDVLKQDKKSVKYREYMNNLTGLTRDFFQEDGMFFDKQFYSTKSQILTRLHGILSNDTFRGIFSSTKNKVDIFEAMNSGKIVLINTAKDFFQSERSALFGRFFIAQILQAANRRVSIPEDKRTPWFVYIDEAWEYFKNSDRNIADLLSQARKFGVGLILSHQYIHQLDQTVRPAVFSTAIKLIGSVMEDDVNTFSKQLRCEPDDLRNLQKIDKVSSDWICSIEGVGTMKVTCPFGVLEKMPEKSNRQYQSFLKENRKKYARKKQEETVLEGEIVDKKSKDISKTYPQSGSDDAWG